MLNTGFITALICCFSFVTNTGETRQPDINKIQAPPFIENTDEFSDSVLNTLTLDEKIAQMFMVAAYSNKTEKDENYINALVRDKKIGGLIFMQGGPERQAHLINRYQASADIPLLIAMDAEWGPSMRLDSTVLYPRQMMLGAVQNNQLLYEIGEEYARQLKALGVHINFAPLVDINVNPKNPVINCRAYGERKEDIIQKAYYFSKGMQDNQVLAVIKHFPGHGDTDKDSHKTLPTISHNRERLDSIELYPFRKLINAGIGGVMVAHLFVPSLDSANNRPSTLSKAIVNDILKEEYGFNGLIFTDALNMKGVADYYKPGQLEVEAIRAGNDVLLFPQDVPKAIAAIKDAINAGKIDMEEIDERVKKIIAAKHWAGLFDKEKIHIETTGLIDSLNNPTAHLLNRKIIAEAVTLVENKNQILPIKALDTVKIASLDLGNESTTTFQKRLQDYTNIPAYNYTKADKETLKTKLSYYNLIIVSISKTSRSSKQNFGLSTEEINFINDLSRRQQVILVHFGNPYALSKLTNINQLSAFIVAYNDRTLTQDITAQMIFGGYPFKGKLPVSISQDYPAGQGINTGNKIRLSYTDIPEEVNINPFLFYKVDSLMNEAMEEKGTPGAEILVARHGTVFFRKSYGYHTYNKKQKVQNSDIYDIASVTKIVATTASLMKLYDEEKWDLNDSLGKHLPFLQGSNKENLKIRDVLTHQARLKPWIPFYKTTINENYNKYYSKKAETDKNIQVAEKMFTYKSMRDSIWQQIADSELRQKGEYRYSDLGFYLMREIVELITSQPIEDYTQENFYRSLGANTTGYNPLQRFESHQIVPTENDPIFRKQLLRGYVHDQGAAMLGGVSGHAGIFSNANDLAKIMQMFLNQGSYGGQQYIKPETMQLFSSPLNNPQKNRRGIGFDKPVKEDDKGPACNSASSESFGHSGFTGILAWVDPETDLMYIFLSNRVHPDMDNKKLLKLDTRTKVQQIFYDAIINE